jgi:hypothetical protein
VANKLLKDLLAVRPRRRRGPRVMSIAGRRSRRARLLKAFSLR